MKDFYKKLHQIFNKQSTKDCFVNKGISPVRHIDLYAGQDYDPQNFEANLFPALFVKWTIDYKHPTPIALLTFRLAYEQLRDLSNVSLNLDEALKFIDFIAITDSIIKKIETPHTGKLTLISEDLSIENTVVDVYVLTYQCAYNGKQSTPQTDYLRGDVDDIKTKSNLMARLLD